MTELFVFLNREHAYHAGFTKVNRGHPEMPGTVAWWPSLSGDVLKGYRFKRAYLTPGFQRYSRVAAVEELYSHISWMPGIVVVSL